MTAAMFLHSLTEKCEIDQAIKKTEDKVLVLRFGYEEDSACTKLDDILMKTERLLSKMASIYTVDVNKIPVYTKYFDITYIPSTVFFFNGQHIKVDFGTPDHTKFVGSFKTKSDFIDLIETIFSGAMKGKLFITSPIDQANIPKFELLYKDY